jgi:hypothetical protein
MTLHPIPLNFLIYEKNFTVFSFFSVYVINQITASVPGQHSGQPMPALWARRRLHRHLTQNLLEKRGRGQRVGRSVA